MEMPMICDLFNKCIDTGICTDIIPVFKKGFEGSKENCRPVSFLPVMLKIFEKLIRK